MLFLKAMTMLWELILALQLPKLVIRMHYVKNSMRMQAYVMRVRLLKSINATFVLEMVRCTIVTNLCLRMAWRRNLSYITWYRLSWS